MLQPFPLHFSTKWIIMMPKGSDFMRIEKLNDHQIRCILTREDLSSREINLLELAYGSDKAKSLFREMLQKASYECGFEANDLPIMIEAIPTSVDSITLIITKVEDPEELDTRFAKFTPGGASSEGASALSALKLEGADDILNLLRKIREAHKALTQGEAEATEADETEEEELPDAMMRMYCFQSLDDVIRAAHILRGIFHGENSLYKHPATGEYLLLADSEGHTPEEFNRICNTLSEYANTMKYSAGMQAYLSEHGTAIVLNEALQRLGDMA